MGVRKIMTPRPAGRPAPGRAVEPATSQRVDMGRRERVNWIPESTRSILNPSCPHTRACCPEDGNVKKNKNKTRETDPRAGVLTLCS